MKPTHLEKKIVVRNEKEIRIILIDSLLSITVDNYLCTFYLENYIKFSCTKSLKDLESLLPEHFLRINRNIIINEHKIQSVDCKNKTILLISGDSYSYSVRKNNLIKQRLQVQS